jgi:hypothetical protein
MTEIVKKKTSYLVFGYDTYYPSGGWNDFLAEIEDIKDLANLISQYNRRFEHYQIIDKLTLKKIK